MENLVFYFFTFYQKTFLVSGVQLVAVSQENISSWGFTRPWTQWTQCLSSFKCFFFALIVCKFRLSLSFTVFSKKYNVVNQPFVISYGIRKFNSFVLSEMVNSSSTFFLNIITWSGNKGVYFHQYFFAFSYPYFYVDYVLSKIRNFWWRKGFSVITDK